MSQDKNEAQAPAAGPSEAVDSASLDRLCLNVLPVWTGQIDMARAHIEDAALNLVNHFVGISARIDQIAATLAAAESAVVEALQASDPDDADSAPARSMAALQASFRILRAEREAISQEVHRGIVALQFQDRVSQVLTHVRTDLEKLRQSVDEHGHLPDSFNVSTWLDQLLRTYSMEQQRDVHHGQTPTAAIDEGDIELF